MKCLALKFSRVLIICLIQIAITASIINAKPGVYIFGVVPQYNAQVIHEIWQPILGILSKKTNVTLSLSFSKSIPEFEKQFAAGDFDIVYMNPYHLIVGNREQGYLPIIKDVGRKLFGIIVVRKDSPFQNIRDLDGQTIAFPSPNALGAALIPRAEFADKFRIKVYPKYVLSHTSVYLNVALNQTKAGGGVQKTFNLQKPEIRDQLRIIHRPISVASHPISVHPRVPIQFRKELTAAILALGNTEHGRSILKKIPINQIGIAKLEDYDPLKTMGLEKFYIR